MDDETLTTINYLTEEQYNQAKQAGKLEENQLYMTPDTTDEGENWHDLEPINGCTTYDSSDPYPKLQYKKIGNEVILKGMFSKAVNGVNAMAQLPVGYRPNKEIYFASSGGDSFASVIIDSSGYIKSPLTKNSWLSLEGIRFFID